MIRAKQALGIGAAGLGVGAVIAGAGAVATALAIRQALKSRHRRDFEGKIVTITGGSRGLGLALALEFGARGAKVAVCARNQQELEAARQRLESAGVNCFTHVCDVSDRESVRQFIGAVRGHFGRIDVLINNAGIIQVGPVHNQQLHDFEEAMAINFWGAVYSTLEVMPEMVARGHGNIVNISSIGGKVAVPHLLPYSAAKFALTGFSEGLRAELHRTGVRVTTICPGLMRTGSQFQAEFKGQHEKEFAWFLLGSSTSLTSISAKRAASQIVNATRRGQAELVISWQAELLARTHGILPELVSTAMALVNRALPDSGGASGNQRKKGRDSESAATRTPLSLPTRWTARHLNEKHA